jgi:hypothetical protein
MSNGCCGTGEVRGQGVAGQAVAGTSAIRPTGSTLSARDRLGHLFARWGVRRVAHRVDPGLYSIGVPGPEAPVFVTANYALSFDALRAALGGTDAYLLVLDTRGINVWCAAGKGTFGTDELVGRIESTGLAGVVSHREMVLPQLGATGVSAHEVRRRSGFAVRYGPVRAEDIPRFMSTVEATREMRTVRFDLKDRLVLIPVELVHVILPCVLSAVILLFVAGPMAAWSAVAAFVAGAVLFPVLLPWLPTPNFSTKGYMLGVVVALPFAGAAWSGYAAGPAWARLGWPLVYILGLPQVVSFLALNFTGSTTFTSKTGVKREIRAYFPPMVWLLGVSLLLLIALAVAGAVTGT